MEQRKDGSAIRIIGLGLLGLGLLLTLALGVILLVLPDRTANNSAARQENPKVLWGGGETTIGLTIALPTLEQCRGQPRPLDIVLLVDASGSMAHEPFTQAIAAAERFIETVDLSRHRLGLMLFDNEVVAHQPLTDQSTPLLTTLRVAAVQGGGTAIEVAIRAGREELTTHRRPEAGAILLLLSDGGSEPQSALEEAARASQENISVVVVGLAGSDWNEVLLRQLATSGIFRVAHTPGDLVAVYDELANQVNQIMGTDLQVREPVNPVFHVLPESVSPPDVGSASSLEWQRGWLTSTTNLTFTYRVAIHRWGLHDVVTRTGEISMHDCTGVPLRLQTPTGPRVLVLPPWWLVPLFLLLPLLGGVALLALGGVLRKRRQPPDKEPEGPSPYSSPSSGSVGQGPSADEMLQAWIKGATLITPDGPPDPASWLRKRPALFVGLGTAGHKVLTDIAIYMRGRCGLDWMDRAPQIRLLHIGVSQKEGADTAVLSNPYGFRSVVLNLSPDQRTRLKRAWHSGLEWFDQTRLGQPGRALGRLAIFANLIRGLGASRLWAALESSIGTLTDVSVYIIADGFSDEVSGMIGDVARLLRVCRGDQVQRESLCLAMQNAHWDDNLLPPQRNQRTFATLRELQRLQRERPIRWSYAPGLGERQLDSVSTKALFDQILLFDGLGKAEGYDLSGLRAAEGVLPALSNCLIALLDNETSRKFYEYWTNEATATVRRAKPGEYVVGAMGCYTLRLPVEEVRRVVEWQLVHRVLFDWEHGLIGYEQMDADGRLQHRGEAVVSGAGPTVVGDFLNKRGLEQGAAARLNPEAVRRHLFAYTEQRLNREGLGLRWAERFVVEMKKSFPNWSADLERMRQAIQRWTTAVGNVTERTAAGEEISRGEFGFGHVPQAQADVQPGPLYNTWEQEWKASTQVLDAAGRMQAQRVFWKLKREARGPREAVQTVAELFDANAIERHAEKMRQRLWWHWFVSPDNNLPLLYLLVLPHDPSRPTPEDPTRTMRDAILASPALCGYHLDDPSAGPKVLQALAEIARAASREELGNRSLEHLFAGKVENLSEEFDGKATPLCRLSAPSPEDWKTVQNSVRYFAGCMGSGSNIEAVHESLQGRMGAIKGITLEPVMTSDPTECRLLHVEHILPIQFTDPFVMARGDYADADSMAELHAWKEEQAARAIEDKARSKLRASPIWERPVLEGGRGVVFSPHFVELWGQDTRAMTLFGQALLYDVLRLDRATWRVSTNLEALAALNGTAVDQAAEAFVRLAADTGKGPAAMETVREAVKAARPTKPSARSDMQTKVRKECLDMVLLENPLAQDIALLLAASLAEESQSRPG